MNDRILVVDDDPQITSLLKRYLDKQNYEVDCVATGQGMRNSMEKQNYDLCILDVGLPDADGFELTRELRESSDIAIILLSVRDESFDKIFGLEYGADDYVTKPFEPRELVARIRSVLRRTNSKVVEKTDADSVGSMLQFGGWVMNLGQRTLINGNSGSDAKLTSMEFDLLSAFVLQPRVVLSRDQLIEATRGNSVVVGDRAIDVHIMRLRKKIEPDTEQPIYLKTIHGIGYCFANDVTRLN